MLMVMLTKAQMEFLLEQSKFKTVIAFSECGTEFRLQKHTGIGYSEDPRWGTIQAALSIGLEVYARREAVKAGAVEVDDGL